MTWAAGQMAVAGHGADKGARGERSEWTAYALPADGP
jgi:hypothetical protein